MQLLYFTYSMLFTVTKKSTFNLLNCIIHNTLLMKKSFAVALVFQLFTLISYAQNLQPFYENGKYGYRSEIRVEIQPRFEYAAHFHEGRAAVKLNGKWGFIDEAGIVVVEPKYAKVDRFEGGYARFYQGNKFGLVNRKGEQVVEAICDVMQVSDVGLILTSNGKKTWVSPSTGKLVSPFTYDYIELEDYFVQCRIGQEYDLYTSKGKLIASKCNESQTVGTSFNAPFIDINYTGKSYLVDSNGLKVTEDFAYIEMQEVNYYEVSEDAHSDYHLLFCYYDDTIEKMKLVRMDGDVLDGVYNDFNYSTERTMFQKEGVPYWFNDHGEMERLNYFNYEEIYEFLILTKGNGRQVLAQVARGNSPNRAFSADTLIIDTFSSIRGLYPESYMYDGYYDGDYNESRTLNLSRIIEVEGLNENKGKYALYDLYWRTLVTPYDSFKKEIREDLFDGNMYVFFNEQGTLAAIVDGKMLDYKFSAIQKYNYYGYVFTDTLENQSFLSLKSHKWTPIPKNCFVINSLNYGIGEPISYFDEETGEVSYIEASSGVHQEFVMLSSTNEETTKYGFIDANAHLVEPQFDSITEDMDFVVQEAPERIVFTWKNGKCGVYNLDYGWISEPIFDSVLKFEYDRYTGTIRANIPTKPGRISSRGKKFVGSNFEPSFFKENGKMGAKEYVYFDDKEELVVTIKPNFKTLSLNSELPYEVMAQNMEKKFGLLHLETGDTLIPFNFTKIVPKEGYFYSDNEQSAYYEVYDKKLYGLYDVKNGNSIPPIYTNIHSGYNADVDAELVYVYKEGKVGLYDRDLVKVLECEYDGITVHFLNDYRLVFATKGDKVYVFNYMFNDISNPNPERSAFDFVVGLVGYRKTNSGYDAFDLPSLQYLGRTDKITIATEFEEEEYALEEVNGLLTIKYVDSKTSGISGLRLIEFVDGDYVVTFDKGITYYQSIYNKKSKYPASTW